MFRIAGCFPFKAAKIKNGWKKSGPTIGEGTTGDWGDVPPSILESCTLAGGEKLYILNFILKALHRGTRIIPFDNKSDDLFSNIGQSPTSFTRLHTFTCRGRLTLRFKFEDGCDKIDKNRQWIWFNYQISFESERLMACDWVSAY